MLARQAHRPGGCRPRAARLPKTNSHSRFSSFACSRPTALEKLSGKAWQRMENDWGKPKAGRMNSVPTPPPTLFFFLFSCLCKQQPNSLARFFFHERPHGLISGELVGVGSSFSNVDDGGARRTPTASQPARSYRFPRWRVKDNSRLRGGLPRL